MENLYFGGIVVGAATFLIIGIFHPIVIKGEYYFGRKFWWFFFVSGIICLVASLFTCNFVGSTILGAAAFSFFWGVKEVFDQEKRILKGWFPENPKRKEYYAKRRAEWLAEQERKKKDNHK
ncbi:MAG: DUF4491 family protein [Bacteroidales bacterium]|nr:DUF4491 family protein [Bacteroidales bacterium]